MKKWIIVACDDKNGIGKNGDLPWDLKKDLKHFKKITTESLDDSKKNAVIMGRKTWESIPDQVRPLPERDNIVLSRNPNFSAKGAQVYASLEEAFQNLPEEKYESIFIIGGANLYHQAIQLDEIEGIYLTKVSGDFNCDVFFPEIDKSKYQAEILFGEEEENGISYQFFLLKK